MHGYSGNFGSGRSDNDGNRFFRSVTSHITLLLLVLVCEATLFAAASEDSNKSHPEPGVVEEALEFILADRRAEDSMNYTKLRKSTQTLIDANATALVGILTDFIVSTRDHPNSSRSAALKVVAAIGDAGVIDLLLEEYDLMPYGWEIAVEGLRRLVPEEFSKKLLQDIQSGETTYAYKNSYNKTIKAFVQVGETSMIPQVIALLDSPQHAAASRILLLMPDERAIPALRRAVALPGVHNLNTHAWAAHALHKLGIDEGLDVLINDLYEVSAVNPHSTGKAIAAIAGERALELYRPLLKDKSPRTRRNALVAMQWMLDNIDNDAPAKTIQQRQGDATSLDAAQELLEVCSPLLKDPERDVVEQARNIFIKAKQTLGRDRNINEEIAMDIAAVLWFELLADPQRQKQLLRKYVPIKKGQPVRLGILGSSSLTSELSDFILDHSQQYVVLCDDNQITLTEKNVPPKPVSISVNISQIGTFHVVTIRLLPRIITVLLRQQQDDWEWEALLGDTVICIHFTK